MRVAYFLQTHHRPEQILRLLATLRRGSPDCALIVGHCPSGEPLDGAAVSRHDALLFRPSRPARRGYWSLLEPYAEAVERLDDAGIDYDWLVYLSGQDYPVAPLAASERRLADGPWDGYLTWRAAGATTPDGRRRQGRLRYLYLYTDRPRARALLPLLRRLNGLQPWWHVHLTYGPRVGRRARTTPFAPGRGPVWGSQWTTLRRPLAERVAEEMRSGSPLARHFARTVCPDEAFAQTVLVHDHHRWRLCNDNLRYADVLGSRDGRPRTLGAADLPALIVGGYAFARKFDLDDGGEALDRLDERVLAAG